MTSTRFTTRQGDEISLLLYMKPTCPYCQKVMRHCQTLGIQLPMVDILIDGAAKARLVDIGGKQQVPCLFINDRPLYESDAIIDFLSNNFKQPGELRP